MIRLFSGFTPRAPPCEGAPAVPLGSSRWLALGMLDPSLARARRTAGGAGLVGPRGPPRPGRFFSASPAAEPEDIALEAEKRKKRLLYRAKMRGWLELDLLIGNFAERYIPQLDAEGLDYLEEILEMENPDLYKWLSGQNPVPDELLAENPVMGKLLTYVHQEHPAAKPEDYGSVR